MNCPRIGLIGGSGLYSIEQLSGVVETPVITPWGEPSGVPRIGKIDDVELVFISRHGIGHRFSPTEVPYAANVCAMKMLGVNHLISVSAVGSLKEEIAPGSFVIPDDVIDRTHLRERTFFDRGIVAHVSMSDPFCRSLNKELYSVAMRGELSVTLGGTYISIEGPQFSTVAESELFRSWGASIIGMTAFPEARFAREAEMCYSCLAMVTDYDVWHQSEETVSVDAILNNLNQMTGAIQNIIVELPNYITGKCGQGCRDALGSAIITDQNVVTDEVRERLDPIAGRYLSKPGSPR